MGDTKNQTLSASKTSSGSLLRLLVRLYHHMTPRRRYQLMFLVSLTLISTIGEIISLGAIVPFIGILTQPEKVFMHPLMEGVVQVLNISSAQSLVLPLVATFATAALISGGLRILLLWVSLRFSNTTGVELGTGVYSKTLHQPYHVHVSLNSSQVISGLTQKVDSVADMILSLVTVGTSTVLFGGVLAILLIIDPFLATLLIACFGSSYIITAWKTNYKLERNSQCIAQEQTRVVKILQEGLGGIRDIILDGSQTIYTNVYNKANLKLRRAISQNRFMSQSPRYMMEILGMVVISVLAYILSHRSESMEAQLPVLGAMALGAQRMIPLLQQLYANWAAVVGCKFELKEVLDLLNQPFPKKFYQPKMPPLKFQTAIRFDNVHFRYGNEGSWILEGINLTIPKGARFGFTGSTGSGKSTTLDLFMALLQPTQGRVLVDGQSISGEIQQAWQNNIAHVPQSIFLTDATIAENIAFGSPPEQIDQDLLREVASLAQVDEFIQSLPESYGTFVGERGIRLSGGQRQRIAIARALYKQTKVLIFDEATSALDSRTEKEVIKAIENLNRDLTILMIAHRLTTLQNCDTIVHLKKGKVFTQGSFEQFKNTDPGLENLPNEYF